MRFTAVLAAIATGLIAACDSPPAQNSPPEEDLVNATATDQAFPSEATGNDIITGDDATQGAVNQSAGNQGAQQGPPQQ